MNAVGADKTGAEHIGLLADLGYDYVELPMAEIMALDEPTFLQIIEMLGSAGIPCEACNNFFPRHMRLTGPDVDHDAIMDYVARAVQRASRLGAKIIVFGSGPAKMSPPGFSITAAHQQLVAFLSEAAPIAAGAGITLAIEPLRREECNLINTFNEGCSLADAVGADNIKVLVDFFHSSSESEDPRHIAVLGAGRLAHVHFAKPEGRGFPADAGDIRGLHAFIKALETAGYSGRISIEAYSDSLAEDASVGLRFMRDCFNF
jgi:sugar phosphate isomerase/epimerase